MDSNDPNVAMSDPVLTSLVSEILSLDPDGYLFAMIIRDTIDQLLDGRRTGRWDYNDLYKTEKTHLGTLLEINLQKYFQFEDGDATDYRINGTQIDCKFSKRIGGWELGPEMVGHYCLVIWASDEKSSWKAGVVKADREYLRDNTNRDQKRRLSEEGVERIHWLWPNHSDLAPNQLLHLTVETRDRIMHAKGLSASKTSVQARVNQLFRELQNVIIRRVTLETVAYGAEDPMKRARGNGGSRDYLRSEGIVVLGHQERDPLIAASLGLPVPHKGEFIATRLVEIPRPIAQRLAAEIDGRYYVIATELDPIQYAPFIARK